MTGKARSLAVVGLVVLSGCTTITPLSTVEATDAVSRQILAELGCT